MTSFLNAATFLPSKLSATFLLGFRSKTKAATAGCGVVRVPASLTSKTNSPAIDIYYPALTPDHSSPESLPLKWLPSYENGSKWGDFLNISETLVGVFTYSVFSKQNISAANNAKLSTSNNDNHLLPVIIFSHGLASWGSHYSAMCQLLARSGCVVLAPDHTDGSATRARMGTSREEEPLYYEKVGHESKEKQREIRARQLRKRVADCEDVFAFSKALNEGSLFDKDGDTSDTLDSSEFRALRSFVGKLDTTSFVAAGHSFGGGTSIAIAIGKSEGCKGAIAFDPWMIPVKDAEILNNGMAGNDTPILAITADTGSMSDNEYWRNNISLLAQISNTTTLRFRGMTHIDIADVPVLLPRIMSRKHSCDAYFLRHGLEIRKFLKEKVGERFGDFGLDLDDDDENERVVGESFVQREPPF